MTFYTSVAKSGNNILLRGIVDGKRVQEKVDYKPTFYIPSQRKNTEYKTIYGQSVEAYRPGSMKESQEWLDEYEDVENFDIYGNIGFKYAFIGENYRDEIDFDMSQINLGSLDIENEIGPDGFPHPTIADERINVITLKRFGSRKYFVFALGHHTPKSKDELYLEFDDEALMLRAFINIWKRLNLDVITGWNCNAYDIPYLVNRISQVLGDDAVQELSPWGNVYSVTDRDVRTMVEFQTYNIVGITVLDYMMLYKKHIPGERESFKLGYITQLELGETKLEYEGSIKHFYTTDFDRFVDYNVQDVLLIDKLEVKLKLVELTIGMAYSAKVNYGDVLHQTRAWDAIIYNYLLARKIVIPPKREHHKTKQFAGAYVKPVQVGMHRWVVAFDVDALYPNIILSVNVGPETKDKELREQWKLHDPAEFLNGSEKVENMKRIAKENDRTLAANGVFYSRKQGFIAAILQDLVQRRYAAKKKMKEYEHLLNQKDLSVDKRREYEFARSKWNIKQSVAKIQGNSCYGALGNEHFRYFDIDNAEAVTFTGQYIIRTLEERLNRFLNRICKTEGVDYILAGDTDSQYLSLESLVKRIFGVEDTTTLDIAEVIDVLDEVCRDKIEAEIDRTFKYIRDEQLHGVGDFFAMKREILASKAIWIAKKNYFMLVYDKEGERYEKPKVKVVGTESKKSTTPNYFREKYTEAIKIYLTTDTPAEIHKFIDEVKKEYTTVPLERIAFSKGVKGLLKYAVKYDTIRTLDGEPVAVKAKKTPYHVQAALTYNAMIDQLGLSSSYPKIMEGEKIKYIALKSPNFTRSEVIAFPSGTIPKEFGLDQFVNLRYQFEKGFMEPMRRVMNAIGYPEERRRTLADVAEN